MKLRDGPHCMGGDAHPYQSLTASDYREGTLFSQGDHVNGTFVLQLIEPLEQEEDRTDAREIGQVVEMTRLDRSRHTGSLPGIPGWSRVRIPALPWR